MEMLILDNFRAHGVSNGQQYSGLLLKTGMLIIRILNVMNYFLLLCMDGENHGANFSFGILLKVGSFM